MEIKGKTYNQLSAAFIKGRLDPYEALNEYAKIRKNAMSQIRKIQKSDVPFEIKPTFKAPSKVTGTDELLHAIADLNSFMKSKSYSKKGRRETRDKAIETLKSHGIDFVTKSNYKQYVEFIRWFYENNLQSIYGSQDDAVEEFFKQSWDTVSGYRSNAKKKSALKKFVKEFV